MEKPRFRSRLIALLFLHLSTAALVRGEDGLRVVSNRVDEKGVVETKRIPAHWRWGADEGIPCLELETKKREIRALKACLTELSSVIPVKTKGEGETRVKARYVFDLPFEYPVVVASPECDSSGIRIETSSLVRGFAIVGVRCGKETGEKIAASPGFKVERDPELETSRDPKYRILNRSGNVAGKFTLLLPPPPPSPTPSPVPVVIVESTPTPAPTPKPKIRRNWVFGGYLGASSVTHQNVAADGTGQIQNWAGRQVHLYFNANRFSPVKWGLIPELEMRMSQGGGLSGVTVAGAYLHTNLLRSKKFALLAGLGGELMGMNGEDRYGIISSLGWAAHVVLRPFDRSFFISATAGPLLTVIPDPKSFWAGILADVRIRLLGLSFHVAADAAWVKVPADVSAVNATYSSTRYGVMIGYYIGE
jgi:hypothetical protein